MSDPKVGRDYFNAGMMLGVGLSGLLFVTLAVILVGVGNVPVNTGEVDEPGKLFPLADLYGANRLTQVFDTEVDGLSRIDLRVFRAYSPDTPLTYELTMIGDQWDAPLRQGTVRCLEEGEWCSLSFAPIEHSAGQSFVLTLRAPAAPADSPFIVGGMLQGGSGEAQPAELSLNGHSVPLNLVWQLRFTPQSPVDWGKWILARAAQIWQTFSTPTPAGRVFYVGYPARLLLAGANVVLIGMLVVMLLSPPQPLRRVVRRWIAGIVVAVGIFGALLIALEALRGVRAARAEPAKADLMPSALVSRDLMLDYFAGNFAVDTPFDLLDIRWFDVRADFRPVLFAHAPSRVSFDLNVPPRATLTFGTALSSEVWDKQEGDGVDFVVTVTHSSGQDQVYWHRVQPQSNPDHRRWFDEQIDLSLYSGQQVTVTLITYPVSNNSWDWAGWSRPRVVVEGD